MQKNLTIATRESPLALWQAGFIGKKINAVFPEIEIKLLGLKTIADKFLNLPLKDVGGKGLFVKELEEALLAGHADIAVHSMKDVPMDLPESLEIPVMDGREDARDVFVSSHFDAWQAIPSYGKIGTSSLRRESQLRALRPDLQIVPLRGNIDTRLNKMHSEKMDGIVLAAAGLKRLGYAGKIKSYFTESEMLPAAGQGVLGIECRNTDSEIKKMLKMLNDPQTFACVTAERAVCRALNGNCQVPIGAYATIENQKIKLRALVANPTGTVIVKAENSAEMHEAEALGKAVANQLILQGAQEILRACQS